MKSKLGTLALAAVLGMTMTQSLLAQNPPPAATENGLAQLALTVVPAKGNAKLTVTSPAFAAGADIPFENTQYRGNIFPGLVWTAGPATTQSYVIIMQDTDSRGATPILHWTMFNIPATTIKLDPGMAAPPTGAVNGPNMRGAAQAYMGPRTPAGPKHRYHFQVFALDTKLTDADGATYAALTAAMKDHVLASGEVIGLGQAPPPGY